ncbi:MAG: exonuclease domain-containing protein [Lachnospiraceae bacterium]|nr:exonuclease domain-containing protein [Lachnospiraceae bacterium]
MNYIVFDLEWNQPQDGKPTAERALAFEIIEIGAVKLDEDFQIVDRYDQLVRPQVYHQINWRIRKMLDLKRGELSGGRLFPRAASEFLEWCGEDPLWCTWGSQDVAELRRNMKFYNMTQLSEDPVPYINVQRLYGIHIGNTAQSRSLETAVKELELPMEVPFHRAYGDAWYTARVLEYLPEELKNGHLSYDRAVRPKPQRRDTRRRGRSKEKKLDL